MQMTVWFGMKTSQLEKRITFKLAQNSGMQAVVKGLLSTAQIYMAVAEIGSPDDKKAAA